MKPYDLAFGAVVLAFLVMAAVATVYRGWWLDAQDLIPRCAEDAVLIGQGDYERGKWDTYVCGPAVDDYKG